MVRQGAQAGAGRLVGGLVTTLSARVLNDAAIIGGGYHLLARDTAHVDRETATLKPGIDYYQSGPIGIVTQRTATVGVAGDDHSPAAARRRRQGIVHRRAAE
jgi:hypothetical protein